MSMKIFQIIAMTSLKALCVLLIFKQTWCVEAQNSDKNWRVVYNRLHSDPSEFNRFVPTDNSQHDRLKLAKRKLDRFRFFHKGLGKRSTELFLDDTKQRNVLDNPNGVHILKTLLTGENNLGKEIPSHLQDTLTRQPDYFFKKMNKFNDLETKRSPEFFSEDLYPLQSGKQELEATLDQTLNSHEDDFENDMLDFDHPVDSEASVTKTNKLPNKLSNDQTEAKSPFDIYFASPDLKMTFENQIKKEHPEEASIKSGQKTKKWWAASMFNKFRSPKSWNRRISNAIHADPAIYFIGLGR